MFSCKDIHDKASHYLDHEAGLMTRLGVLFHLLMCGQCRQFLKQLKLAVSTVSRLKPEPEITTADMEALADKLHAISCKSEAGKQDD
ncbi:zf-HC2 domain-containing protein [Methylophaga sp. OBS4]|uniref:zf-HC2 domain-containing protein n=1 Tax=Methylophaga sp. OBS4 TaxID=2991935 RepID=UPI002250D42F|nr:zf-HC2 domain-containing protein [Methylophaga sp. OBS4]